MIKKIALLGATGSIGKQTQDVVRAHPDKFKIVAMTARSDRDGLICAVQEFAPKFCGIICGEPIEADCESAAGGNVNQLAVNCDCDIVVAALSGLEGLSAVMSAIQTGKTVALANKESLVCGGELVMRAAKEKGVDILPVDSEHSAIWQSMNNSHAKPKRLILTASGGAYYFKDKAELEKVKPSEAVKHPNWNMGKKISVDSATMMNKALEIIEARFLFDTTNIDYVIHPESIVHSMVEYEDGSIISQSSFPDMRLPIQYALTYPDRIEREFAPIKLPLSLNFYPPNEQKFKAPMLAREALKMGGTAPCVFAAADEGCVELFLKEKIGFTDICDIVERTLFTEKIIKQPTLSDIYAVTEEVKTKVLKG